MKEKKQWHKPALIVLVRCKPEEAVLQGCKVINGGGPAGVPAICEVAFCEAGVTS